MMKTLPTGGSARAGRLKPHYILLIVSLGLILIGSLFASLIQSSFGGVDVSSVTFPTRDGQWVAADLYKPDSAAGENKAPLVVVIPGFQRSRETQAGIASELSRRGIVVINIDPYSQGDSSSSVGSESPQIASYEGYGAFDIINYVHSSNVLNYVDKTRIGVTGHSAGGNAAYQAAVHFGKDAVNNNGVSKVRAAYVSGYVISFDYDRLERDVKSNMGFDYALYDEGAFRNKPAGGENAPTSDMTVAVESHEFVNSVLPEGEKVPASEPVEMGRIYGNPVTGTMRQVFNTPTIHAWQPYAQKANTALLSFFEVALDYNYEIRADRHIWPFKEVFTTLSLIGAFMFLVPFAKLLFAIPFFRSAKAPVPPPVKKRDWLGQLVFWVTFALNAVIAAVTFIPMSKLTAVLFPDATASLTTWFFPQRMNNAVMLWAVLNGVLGMITFLAAFFGLHFLRKYLAKRAAAKAEPIVSDAPAADPAEDIAAAPQPVLEPQTVMAAESSEETIAAPAASPPKKKRFALSAEAASAPLSIESWGLKIKPLNLLKTLLVALMITGTFFLLLHTVNYFFKVDFRFLFIVAARPVNVKVVLQALMYVPLFFIFYLSNSIRVNGNMRVEGQREWLSLLIAGLANTLGLILILVIQYAAFGATGTVFWTETPEMTEWLYVNILFGLIPVMFILPLFNRWFFKASGKTWLGPTVMCIIFITMMINNSVAYIPL